ncbi:hypothetical protein J4477_04135 [Candidatus Pacearchaeota archaeon]|nr:hypothetical protein [Candidatus Pacearchaeota archaeon]
MGWKDGMYWLKGILLSTIINMVVTLLILFYIYLNNYIINPPQGTNYSGLGMAIIFWYMIALSLIIIPLGAALGFFYGKYKNKLLIWIPLIIYLLILILYFSRF